MKTGICAICGEDKQLSFEHVPPKSCFNSNPIFKMNYQNLDSESVYYNKKYRSNAGFGGYTLCQTCNSNNGSWYGGAFKDFVHSGMQHYKGLIAGSASHCYTIKPLNVLKQVMCMFMSANKNAHLRKDKELVDFLLNPENQYLPEKYSVLLYCTNSTIVRFFGLNFRFDFIDGKPVMSKFHEISFKPFGYLLTEDTLNPYAKMLEITSFKNYKYNQVASLRLDLPYLETNTHLICDYRTKKEIDLNVLYN